MTTELNRPPAATGFAAPRNDEAQAPEGTQATHQLRRHSTTFAAAIPAELKALPQWLCWRLELRKGELTKPPYNAKTGNYGKSNDPATWCTFETALAAYQLGGYSGIGFAFRDGDGLTGLDLDHVIDPVTGTVDPRALEILDHFKGTYCEVSPSGTGLRIFCRGRPGRPGKNEGRAKWLEVYDHTSPRYLTVTGNYWQGAAAAVTEQQVALDWLHARYFAKPASNPSSPRPAADLSLDDTALIEKASNASNGVKFRALWAGDTSAYGNDHSAADFALCALLAFWTGKDPGRIDRLFRLSGLMRDKWNREDYRQRTIDKAISECTEVYTGSQARGNGPPEREMPPPYGESAPPKQPVNDAPASDDELLADYVTAESLDGQPFTRTWLVENLIEQGRVYEFFGKYKEGKTLAVIDLAAHLSLSRTWGGRRTVQALVIWVAGEAVDDVKMRVAAWRLRQGVSGAEHMPFYIRVKPVHMTAVAYAVHLAREIEALKRKHPALPVLLAIDTVARCMAPGVAENSIEGLGAFANNVIDHVARPTQAAVINIHHSGHGDSDRGRGHSSFEAAMDGIIKVCMDKSSGQPVITISAVRMRSTTGDDLLSFRVEVQELPGQDNLGNPIAAPVLRYLPNHQAIQQPTGKHENAAYAILERQGSMLLGDWRKAFYDKVREAESGILYDTLKKAWRRTQEALTAKRLVVVQDKTASIIKGGQTGHVPPMSPCVPGIRGGEGQGHIPIGMSLCPPPVPPPAADDEEVW